jgi:ATP-dependent RNA helicase SUPV3L1/SUV3
VDHVAFASRAKFDGRRNRRLRADELAQIAGRAGRFRSDGGFGETADCPALGPELAAAIENHSFDPVETIEWRNSRLSFDSPDALLESLARAPPDVMLRRCQRALDEETFQRLLDDDAIAAAAAAPTALRRLWSLCQLPDFRKSTVDEHVRLTAAFAQHLVVGAGRLHEDMIAREMAKLDREEGDLDALQARLAHVRTWTYAANRADWLADPAHWRERTRLLEDKLSDLLHAGLAARFVDRRTSALLKGLKREDALLAGVDRVGEVTVEGHYVGRLVGLVFEADSRAVGLEEKALRNAAIQALRPEVTRRLAAVAQADDDAFTLAARELCVLKALEDALSQGLVSGLARGLAYRLAEAAGALPRARAQADIEALSAAERRALRALGVRFGRQAVFLPALLKPRPARLLALFAHAAAGGQGPLFLPPPGAASTPRDPAAPGRIYAVAGYYPAGPRAIRFDVLDRFADHLWTLGAGKQGVPEDPALAAMIGAPGGELGAILKALGYHRTRKAGPAAPALWRAPRPAPLRRTTAPGLGLRDDSPFAALSQLRQAPAPSPAVSRRRRKRKSSP